MKRLSVVTTSIALLLVSFFSQSAFAQHHKHHRHSAAREQIGLRVNGSACLSIDGTQSACTTPARFGSMMSTASRPAIAIRTRAIEVYAAVDDGEVIGGRPEGCPHAYCGCGLRKYLGLSDVRLNLASNWARFFPREAAPRAGLAAVRTGHVMYIEASAGPGLWKVRDYNSGGGLSRVHVRDVRGYIFVDPRRPRHGVTPSRVASQESQVAIR
jgi:hypothetical protein